MLTYALPILTLALAFSQFLHKQKQNGNQQRRSNVDKSLHQEKGYGSKKLLAEFPNKPFELLPTVFLVLAICVFSVSSKR